MLLNRIAEPSISIPESISFQEVEKIVLKNNVPLYILNAGTQDLCRIEVIYKAGEVHSNLPLVATAVNDLLDAGTKRKNAFEVAEAFDFYGSYLQTESNSDYSSVKLYTLNKHLQNTLPLLIEILSEAIFPEDELETYKQQNYQRLKINNEKVDVLARKNFLSSIFDKNHPYGYFITKEHYQNLNTEHLKSFHKNSYLFNNAFILVSGRFSDNEIKIINELFGQVIEDNPPVKLSTTTEYISKDQPQKIRIQKKAAIQSAIRIGKAWHNKTHPDFHKMIIATTILGGYFGSRLMKNIREDKGYTYGVGSSLSSFLQAGFISISTQVGTDVCDNALEEIYKEIEEMRNDFVSEEELSLVKNYLFGSFQRSIDGPFALADKFKNIAVFQLGYDYYLNYIKLLKTVTPDQILQTTLTHWGLNSFNEVVVG